VRTTIRHLRSAASPQVRSHHWGCSGQPSLPEDSFEVELDLMAQKGVYGRQCLATGERGVQPGALHRSRNGWLRRYPAVGSSDLKGRNPPKAAVAGSPVTNRRSEPASVVAAAPCQCRVALPPRFCIGTLTFGDHPVLCRGRVSPGPCDFAHRLPANPEVGRRSPVLQLFSDGRQKQCRSENNQACPVGCHSAWSRIRAVSVLNVCQPDRRPPAIRTGYKSRRAQDRFRRRKNQRIRSRIAA
jgi:hypothetical protein